MRGREKAGEVVFSFKLEGKKLLTNDDAAEITYIARITDTAEFDPLFTEVLVLQLAIRFTLPLAKSRLLMRELNEELIPLMTRVRAVDKQEQNTVGRADRDRWVDKKIRLGRIDSKLGGQ